MEQLDSPSRSTSASPRRRIIQLLDQGPYRAQQPVQGIPAHSKLFNGEEGVLLSGIHTLSNGDEAAFDSAASIGVKATMRFQLFGFETRFPLKQVNVRRGSVVPVPITMQRMFELVRDDLRRLMDHSVRIGEPLKHHGCIVSFEKIVLLRVQHVSKSSFQPILGIWDNYG